MITEREQEILLLIRQDPLISQQALADRLGITRSAVAGHIMNLTNKGAIRGKGYIVADAPYAVVIGGANMDILGQPATAFQLQDSNPGRVSCSPGGVGRNIAENLARLGADSRLIAPIGKDAYGQMLLEHCQQAGIDMRYCLLLDDATTSTYLSILDASGDMHVAINDMAIIERLRVETLVSHAEMLRRASLLIIDTNLSREVLEYLLSQFSQVPIFVDTVSGPKSEKLRGLLGSIHTLKPNLLEAQQLSGLKVRSDEDLPGLAAWFHQQGVKRLCLSLSARGTYLSEMNDQGTAEQQILPPLAVDLVNANGAGDAFLAGLAHGWLQGWQSSDAARFAVASAALTLTHPSTINPTMSVTAVERLLQQTEALPYTAHSQHNA